MSKNRTYTQNEVNALLAAQGLSEQTVRYVGIRWFGYGGVTVRMKNGVAGNHSVVLQGYGDAGVIDHGTWRDLKKGVLVKQGLIVRDDSVIEAEGFAGVIEASDTERPSPNGFLDDEIIKVFESPIGKFKQTIANLTTHQACTHFLHVAKEAKIDDVSRTSIINSRYMYLLTKYRWSLLLDHDLRPACEQYQIDWGTLTRDEVIEALTRVELETEH